MIGRVGLRPTDFVLAYRMALQFNPRTFMPTPYRELKTCVSDKFEAMAERFKVSRYDLAFSILDYFANHPERLCLVSNDPSRARSDTQPLSL
jgi:hypothetical protein